MRPILFLLPLLFVLNQACTGNTGNEQADQDGDPKLLLPFPEGSSYTVTQGYHGSISHNISECDSYAIDFNLAEGDPITSVADGRVMMTREDSNTGGALLDEYSDDANYVFIDYGNGYYGQYFHLCYNCVSVEPGDLVEQGDLIGYAGNTGRSDSPHLHFQLNAFSTVCSVPYGFHDVPDDAGMVVDGTTYTSQNDGSGTSVYEESVMGTDIFNDEHGITLDVGLPWRFSAGDTLTASGTVSNGKPWVVFFLMTVDGVWITGATQQTTGAFSLSLNIPADQVAGNYLLGMATADTDYYMTDWAPYVLVENP